MDSPLCADLMEDLHDISQSIGDETLGFDFPEYQRPGSESESSIALGELSGDKWCRNPHKCTLKVFPPVLSCQTR